MQFNSLDFLVFFVIVLVVYHSIGHRPQNIFLLVASYVFYGWWDWRFLLLLFLSTVIDYVVALGMASSRWEHRKKLLLVSSIGAQLTMLAFFKYFGFFVDSFGALTSRIGLEWNPTLWSIILPVGISFYTFQTMSYTIDVYRGRLTPTRSLLDFSLFVSFFPQLVAGPIERATHLLPQIQQPRKRPSESEIASGLALIVFGLFRKVVIADTLAPIVDRIFGQAPQHSWQSLTVAVVAFSLQIYGDFAGYSDIARGTARLLGFDLMRNFRQPYLARNITEFWHRWHISLSTWLRDYLYVPLGGNRSGRTRTYINLLLVMLLGGLWHGAGWTFVIWGGLHGFMLAAHRVISRDRGIPEAYRVRDVFKIPMTLVAVAFAWVFFRAGSFSDALLILKRIAGQASGFFDLLDAATVGVLFIASFALDIAEAGVLRRTSWLHRPSTIGLATGVAMAAILVASGSEIVPFIYFQF